MNIDEKKRLDKNQTIKQHGQETRQRRANMTCRVFSVKIVSNKLSNRQKEQIYGQFREAKWIRNDMLSRSNEGENIFSIDYKDYKVVKHFDKNKNPLFDRVKYLAKRGVQTVVSGFKDDIRNLAKAKAKGCEVGSLKFISEYTSLNLPQYGNSYKITGKSKIRINKVDGDVRVRGLEQIYNLTERYEIANAKLIQKPDGLYVNITVYVEKSESRSHEKPFIGVDMGCETSLTLSNGEKIKVQVGETERLKGLQRKLDGCKKGSNNRRRVKRQIRKEHQHISNIRCDKAHKVLHRLSSYRVVMQDEQLANWAENGHGKKVSHGILGRVKTGLMSRPDTFVLSQWIPTTKMCTECGEKVELSLHDRTFVCPNCGHTEDRDVHAAKNMLWFFGRQKTLCVERTEYCREEFDSDVRAIFGVTSHETAESLAQR